VALEYTHTWGALSSLSVTAVVVCTHSHKSTD